MSEVQFILMQFEQSKRRHLKRAKGYELLSCGTVNCVVQGDSYVFIRENLDFSLKIELFSSTFLSSVLSFYDIF